MTPFRWSAPLGQNKFYLLDVYRTKLEYPKLKEQTSGNHTQF
ncbi:MAG: hypothetical protein ACR5K9_00385 [Wolbachia sp.]